MKVWHLVSNRWFSAITAYGINASRALSTMGYSCHITVLRNSPAEQNTVNYGMEVSTVSSFNLSNFKKLAKLFKLIEPRYIIAYGGPEEIFARLVVSKSNTSVIRFCGSSLKRKRNWFLSSISSWGTDAYLSPNNTIKDAISQWTYNKKPSFMVQFGTDHLVFKPQTNQTEHNDNRLKLLIFGRFDPIKGHNDFFAIFAELLKRTKTSMTGSRPFLLIAGLEANLSRYQLMEEASSHDLIDGYDFEILDQRFSDPVALMQTATIGVVSSTGSEDICRVAEEFLLCGIPIFVSGFGALAETLFNNAGESYHSKERQEAARILHSLLLKSMKETAKERGQRASKACELFSLPSMGKKLSRVLESLNLNQ